MNTTSATATKMNATTSARTLLMTMYGDRSGEARRIGTSSVRPPRSMR
ncbi:MAG TPA: hypothetical protein VNA69_02635 [Thermoanaerobaculia bacterium]|nr:hypothetical protein [Thermoanaerobaculia bacterium]